METNFGPLSSKSKIKLEFDIIVMFLPFHCLGLFNDKNTYCAGRNCINSLQRNQPENYKYATGTVNHESDLLSCEISLGVHVLIRQINCSSLSLQFHLAISE